MVIHALAVDYDGTIAENGRTASPAVAALARVRASGRRVVLVTGRILPELREVCPDVDGMFDAVVAENGAVLYLPGPGRAEALGAAPEPALLQALRRHGVEFKCGLSIVATLSSFATPVREAIQEAGVPRVLEFNKEALMLLPAGITKGTGVQAALDALGVAAASAAAIGDAENDDALLAACGWGVAVADAVPALRARAWHVTRAPASRGVIEFVEEYLLGAAR
jgi:hydroxymethylpyrimidine pyrophosphatase-like HAD family hydrolase